LVHHFYKKTSENGERTLAAKAEVTEVAYNAELHSKVPLPEALVVALKRCMQP
jgi:acyl-CoA thioesterase FadM